MKEGILMGSIAIIAALFMCTCLFSNNTDHEREEIIRAHKDRMGYYLPRH